MQGSCQKLSAHLISTFSISSYTPNDCHMSHKLRPLHVHSCLCSHFISFFMSGELRSQGTAYLGCFSESAEEVDSRIDESPLELRRSDNMVMQCITHCSNNNLPFAAITRHSGQPSRNSLLRFFGLFLDYYCRCGRSYGTNSRVADDKCPGAKAMQGCFDFQCYSQMFTAGDYYSVFSSVDHPTGGKLQKSLSTVKSWWELLV